MVTVAWPLENDVFAADLGSCSRSSVLGERYDEFEQGGGKIVRGHSAILSARAYRPDATTCAAGTAAVVSVGGIPQRELDMASTFAPSRPLAVLAAAALGVVLFSGCTPADEPEPSNEPSASASATPEPSATPSVEPSEAAVMSQPLDITCDELITLDDMYAFNPNVSAVADAAPKKDSKAGVIAGMNGLTCQWINNSSSETIDIAVAKLTDDQLTALKNLAVTESKQVPTYGTPPVEGYFQVIGQEGEAQVFSGSYWVTLRAISFFEPGDAEQLAEAAIEHLS